MDDDDFNIFSSTGNQDPKSFHEVMEFISHLLTEHQIPVHDAIDIFIDMMRPGTSDNSHDVRPMWTGAMYALGFGHIAGKFQAIWLNTMPWGIGFSISVEQDFRFNDLPPDAQRAVIASIVAVIQAGGLDAEIGDDNRIILHNPDGERSEMTTDEIVGQFRHSMEKELGPDAPDDPMDRWMPRD